MAVGGQLGGSWLFWKGIMICGIWNVTSWGNWEEIVFCTAGRTRWDWRWPWMMLSLQQDTFTGMMGFALVWPALLPYLKPFLLLDAAKGASIPGDIQSPNWSRQHQTQGCELGREGANSGVEGMDLAKAISGGQIWTHLQRQNWNETCRPTSQKHDPSSLKPQHAVIYWINVLYKWTCALGWGKAGNQDSSSKPVGTITTDHVRALTDFLNVAKFKLSAGETHWAGISPPHPQEHYPSNNSEFPPGMQEMCLAWGPGGSLQEAGGGSGGASHPLPALESRKNGHV